MLTNILMFYNFVLGFLFYPFYSRMKKKGEVKQFTVVQKVLVGSVLILGIISYVAQFFLVLVQEYKMAMIMSIICFFAIVGMNSLLVAPQRTWGKGKS